MSNCQSLRVVFAGTPDFAANALQALIDSDHQVVGVLTQPDRPAGRGRALKASPVKELAQKHNLPVQQPLNFSDEKSVSELSALDIDVMVVAAYGIILPASVLSVPRLGCLNIHASLLPRWRGAAPIQRALLDGDTESGVCIMSMDEGLDTGDVISTVRISLNKNMTGGELHDELAVMGADALVASLSDYCEGKLVPMAQPETGVTYAQKLNKAEAALDFSQTAIALHRKIQAFNPWPVCHASVADVKYRIWKSRIPNNVAVPDSVVPGQVISIDDATIRVATAEGVLDIIQIQKPGKKPMDAADFNRGTDLTGQVFT